MHPYLHHISSPYPLRISGVALSSVISANNIGAVPVPLPNPEPPSLLPSSRLTPACNQREEDWDRRVRWKRVKERKEARTVKRRRG